MPLTVHVGHWILPRKCQDVNPRRLVSSTFNLPTSLQSENPVVWQTASAAPPISPPKMAVVILQLYKTVHNGPHIIHPPDLLKFPLIDR